MSEFNDLSYDLSYEFHISHVIEWYYWNVNLDFIDITLDYLVNEGDLPLEDYYGYYVLPWRENTNE